MGLAGPRQRNKIGTDPNNTKWAKSTDRFGHKILTSQGWRPGDTLGAENASHASHYTTASSSHIRVLLREDGLGLGAKNGRQEADRFGLDMFQGLLGRLNGKSEATLEKEAGYRRDLALKEMVVKRFGGTTFVSGGYLVGDKIERSIPSESSPSDVVAVKEKKSKKRKRTEEASAGEELPSAVQQPAVAEFSAEETISKRERKNKDKKRKKRKGNEEDIIVVAGVDAEAEPAENASDGEVHTLAASSEKELKRQRKAEKRAAKEARRQEKQERNRKRREVESKDEAASSIPTTPTDTSEAEVASDATSLQRTAAVPRGRFAVRSRYSQQKRMAVNDQQALKEIFMIKAGA